MQTKVFAYVRLVLLCVLAATLGAGCVTKDDPVAQAEKKDVAKGVPAPSIAETKAIAEEGFIYGLPLVMNYAVMNDFNINREFRPIQRRRSTRLVNEARVFTYKDTAIVTPNSDTPYSILRVEPRAEPVVFLRSQSREDPLLLRAAHGHVLLQLRIRGVAGPLEAMQVVTSSPGPTGKAKLQKESSRHSTSRNAIWPGDLPHPTVQPCRHRQREENPGRLHRSAAVDVPAPAWNAASTTNA